MSSQYIFDKDDIKFRKKRTSVWAVLRRILVFFVATISMAVLYYLVFALFFIPGTPKDLLTYFVGLTDMKLGTFLLISLVGRLPSVLSSTVGGHLLGDENYMGAIWLYAITGAVSLAGLLTYNAIIKRKQEK